MAAPESKPRPPPAEGDGREERRKDQRKDEKGDWDDSGDTPEHSQVLYKLRVCQVEELRWMSTPDSRASRTNARVKLTLGPWENIIFHYFILFFIVFIAAHCSGWQWHEEFDCSNSGSCWDSAPRIINDRRSRRENGCKNASDRADALRTSR